MTHSLNPSETSQVIAFESGSDDGAGLQIPSPVTDGLAVDSPLHFRLQERQLILDSPSQNAAPVRPGGGALIFNDPANSGLGVATGII